MVIAGLTGGIATGKSTVAGFFRSAGAAFIDADRIAFDAVHKGMPAWHEIVSHFGKEVLLDGGQIDRAGLGNIIFNDRAQKDVLDSIVHPAVFKKIHEKISILQNSSPDSVVIVDIPLLIETGGYRDMDEVIVVYVPEHIQIERLLARDNISEEAALARIRSQMSIEDKKAYAGIVIDNSKSMDETKSRTLEVYLELKDRAVAGRL
ncbi:MAG TPA: dephospho-CoA kinase [Deltaproteobacteria bacterium]|nr:dephospho-CoA kinase [Deltaproteobacteria bacterium]